MRSLLAAAALLAVLSPSMLPAREVSSAMTLSKLPANIDKLMADWNVPGLSIAAVKGDQVI
jgi:CubicO group peptidase (beta-lactamase class C family)